MPANDAAVRGAEIARKALAAGAARVAVAQQAEKDVCAEWLTAAGFEPNGSDKPFYAIEKRITQLSGCKDPTDEMNAGMEDIVAAAALYRPLVWSREKEKPTEPGMYWHRRKPTSERVEVRVSINDGDVMIGSSRWHQYSWEFPRCQFAGPLPEPLEPQEDTTNG